MKHPHQTRAVLFILLQSIVYGFGNPLTKVAYESITPFWCLFFRFTIAFVIFMLFFGRSIITQIKAARVMDYLPVSLCMALAYISCNMALSMTSATNVGFLMSLPVIFTPVLSVFILKETYPFRHLPLQLTVIIGLVMLCMQGQTLNFAAGDFLALLTAVFVAGALVFGKKSLGTHLDAVAISAAQSGCTALLSLVCAFLFDDVRNIFSIQPAAWYVVIYLALFCTCAAYVLQNTALSWSSPALVSMVQCSQPILTAIVAWVILGENLSLIGMIGAAIIIICTVLESYLER